MKRLCVSLLLLFAWNYSYSQNTYPWSQTGYVGIGTTNPTNRLSIFEPNENNCYATISNNIVGTIIGAGGAQFGLMGTTSNHDFAFYTGLVEKMRLTKDGKVGIGTRNPLTTLYLQNDNKTYSSTLTLKNTTNDIAARAGLTMENDAGHQTYFYKQASGNYDANDNILYSAEGNTRIYTGGEERFRIAVNGNIGIGTSSPADKLSVNGNIRAKEIKVETSNWPDYVFHNDYDLRSLTALKAYIELHHHLPEMPSEKEIIKEGLDLGKINNLLLRKVEELTLYLIEKDEAQKTQATLIEQQALSLKALTDRLDHLEKERR
jgi:hypothetical protein